MTYITIKFINKYNNIKFIFQVSHTNDFILFFKALEKKKLCRNFDNIVEKFT